MLCSMDHEEIYITIAEYDEGYEAYVRSLDTTASIAPPRLNLPKKDGRTRAAKVQATPSQGQGSSTPKDEIRFLTMTSYGPWCVRETNDIRDVCRILLSLSLYLSKEQPY